MKNKVFWNWVRDETEPESRTLYLNGVIAEESWFSDEVTPAAFKADLTSGSGPITVWINSVGGDCVAAAQIYNMLMEYPHNVTVKIDGIAASAASVIAMAGTRVLMSPTSLLMLHNPFTVAMGDSEEMRKAIQLLEADSPALRFADRPGVEQVLSMLVRGTRCLTLTPAAERLLPFVREGLARMGEGLSALQTLPHEQAISIKVPSCASRSGATPAVFSACSTRDRVAASTLLVTLTLDTCTAGASLNKLGSA